MSSRGKKRCLSQRMSMKRGEKRRAVVINGCGTEALCTKSCRAAEQEMQDADKEKRYNKIEEVAKGRKKRKKRKKRETPNRQSCRLDRGGRWAVCLVFLNYAVQMCICRGARREVVVPGPCEGEIEGEGENKEEMESNTNRLEKEEAEKAKAEKGRGPKVREGEDKYYGVRV